jgi:hypothetical protein
LNCFISLFLQALLVPLVILDPKGLALDTSVASSWFSIVKQIKNLSALWACPISGLGTVYYTWKDRRKHTIKTLVCIFHMTTYAALLGE